MYNGEDKHPCIVAIKMVTMNIILHCYHSNGYDEHGLVRFKQLTDVAIIVLGKISRQYVLNIKTLTNIFNLSVLIFHTFKLIPIVKVLGKFQQTS